MYLLRIVLVVTVLSFCFTATAHQLRPTIIDIMISESGEVVVQVKSNFEAVMAGIGPGHDDTDDSEHSAYYQQLRSLELPALYQNFHEFSNQYTKRLSLTGDSASIDLKYANMVTEEQPDLSLPRLSTVNLDATLPPGIENLSFRYPADLGNAVVRVHLPGNSEIQRFWLENGAATPEITLDGIQAVKGTWDTAIDYTVLGFTHILPKGVDHILFVLGLFLLSVRLKPLLLQVTAFTLAHTVTLALTVYGFVSFPPSIVEPIIALSIVYIAIENLVARKLTPWRLPIVFIFGLLHGMGFGGVLLELGLPGNEFLLALLTFNIGVELGQIVVLIIAFALVGFLAPIRRHQYSEEQLAAKTHRYRRWVVRPGSLIIGVIGAYWFFERIL